MENRLDSELVEWAHKFLKMAVWRELNDSDNFCIQHDSFKKPAFISIMGKAGISYGLSIWRGLRSYLLLQGLINGDIDRDTAFSEGDLLCIGKCKNSEMPAKFKRYLANAGYKDIHSDELPLIYVLPPYKEARAPSKADARYLLFCVRTTVDLYLDGRLRENRFKPGNSLLTFFLRDSGDKTRAEEKYVVYAIDRGLSRPIELDSQEHATLRSLGKNNSTYLISYFIGPFSIQDRMPRLLLVYDKEKDKILFVEVFEGGEPLENVNRKLISVFKGKNPLGRKGLPKQIITDSKYLYDSTKKYLARLGIRVVCSENVPELEAIKEDFIGFMKNK